MIAEHGDELRDKLPAAIELIKGALDYRDQAVRAKATEVAALELAPRRPHRGAAHPVRRGWSRARASPSGTTR